MTAAQMPWPKKTREVQMAVMDSTRWNGFAFRDDDIVIATWPKSGTTWMQQIVSQLIFRGAESIPIERISLWVDCLLYPPELLQALDAQTHRRFLKTHLPLDALVFSPRAKYIYVARDGRDYAWSAYNHMASTKPEIRAQAGAAVQALPAEVTAGPVQFFRFWLENGSVIFGDFWLHQQQWWDARRLPNLLLVHYNNLKSHLAGQMRRVADFLGIQIEDELWPVLVEHCTFDYMKRNGSTLVPIADTMLQRGADDFIHKGTNGRWRDLLTQEDINKYERLAKERLTPDCAHWLATGELPEGESR
jgi:aryl sulfotransferase